MLLDFPKTQKLLEKYNIPYVKSKIVRNKKEILSSSFQYPLVLKITDKLHKTEVKGVSLNINNKEELIKEYKRLSKISKNIIVQEMTEGQNVIIGAKLDLTFGPILLFGMGGIFVEIIKDVSFRLAPINKKQAQEMLKEIKGYPILKGVRGKKGVKIEDLEKILVNLSNLITNEKVKEIDLNPVIVNQKETKVVDAKVLL
jgi:acyl-CoA synthetase (NDP forming)